MRSRIMLHGLSCSPMRRNTSFPEVEQSSLTGAIATSEFFSCTSSRGVMRATATFDISRSMSPIISSCCFSSSRPSVSRKKCSTTSRRLLICGTSFSGNSSQRRSSRAPIGDRVRSITESRLLPSSHIESRSSRLRTVNLSRRTYRSSSMRDSAVICPMWVCWVMSR